MKRKIRRSISILLALLMFAGVLPISVSAEAADTNVGTTFNFGTYPQTLVTSRWKIDRLRNCSGVRDGLEFYFGTGSLSDGEMKPIVKGYYYDFFDDGKKYRAVWMSEFAPAYTGFPRDPEKTEVVSGFQTNELYFFEYTPLTWRVVQSDSNGSLCMCENVIDTSAFQNVVYRRQDGVSYIDKNSNLLANSYVDSNILGNLMTRFWLTAFTEGQRNALRPAPEGFGFVSPDRIFLPTAAVVKNCYDSDGARRAYSTEYARYFGAESVSAYWLSTPGEESSLARYVSKLGGAENSAHVTKATYGVRPMIYLSDPSDDTAISASLFSSVGHESRHCYYNDASYWTWASDYTSARAEFRCVNGDDSFYVTDTAPRCVTVSHQSCSTDEVIKYRATVEFQGVKHSDDSVPIILRPATGAHIFTGDPTWEWAKNKSGATATFICSVCNQPFTFTDCNPQQRIIDEFLFYEATVSVNGQTYTSYSSSVGDILFGTYPQTRVTDSTTLAALDAFVGSSTFASRGFAWKDYEYYRNNQKVEKMMEFADFFYGGQKYRAVRINSNRDPFSDTEPAPSASTQLRFGYNAGETYYFLYEPIPWHIVEASDGSNYIVSAIMLDAQPFTNTRYVETNESYSDSGCGTYASNFAHSSLRSWLNDSFYNTAFSEAQKENIRDDVAVDNDSAFEGMYNAESTTDQIYLMSAQEVQAHSGTISFVAPMTDYVKCQGISNNRISFGGDPETCALWRLRTPYDSKTMMSVDMNGALYTEFPYYMGVTDNGGICPACRLENLAIDTEVSDVLYSSGTTCQHNYIENWTWATDHSSAAFTLTCTACGYTKTKTDDHPQTVTVSQPTCRDNGVIKYTATVTLNGKTYTTQSDPVEIPDSASGLHTVSGAPRWTWAADYSSAEAVFTCVVCNTIFTRTDISPRINLIQPATATQNKVVTYSAEVSYLDVTYTTESEEVTVDCSALGHSFVNYVYNGDATCTADGTETATCSRCGEATDIRTAAGTAGHVFEEYVYNNDATCTADGTETATCSRCGATDTRTRQDTASGHSFTNYVYNGDATCTADGTETAVCDRCDVETDTRVKAGTALGHSFTNYVYNGDATCTADGTETAVCDNCGQVTNSRVKDGSALGHSFTDYEYNNNATCTADGTETAVCDRCGNETDERVKAGTALGHSFTEYVYQQDATCTADGTETAVCDRCGEVTDTRTRVGSALGHSFAIADYVYNNDATCTEDGTQTAVCDRCGDATDTCVKPGTALGHSFTTYVYNGDATCTADGTRTAVCDRCGSATDTKDCPGTATGHSYALHGWNWSEHYDRATANFVCAACGDQQTVTDAAPVAVQLKAATETADQVVKYVAVVVFEGKTYTGETDPVTVSGTVILCPWDHVNHGSSFFGKLVRFFHGILYFFTHLQAQF
ncbi:MAG: hypothetical protein IJL52_09865 [Clostridia bacterium]|nr:hypothetical protein [Clostridia bacterium]